MLSAMLVSLRPEGKRCFLRLSQVDVTEVVDGHFAYLSRLGDILTGINVDSYYPIYPSKLKLLK